MLLKDNEPEIISSDFSTKTYSSKESQQRSHQKEVVTYYEDTGLDYGEWSKEFNMHFGYYKWPMNPFRRERMLDEMNLFAFKNLQLTDDDIVIFDLGCGLAAPCRSLAKNYPGKKIKGITLVQWQIEKAGNINKSTKLNSSIEMVLGDYTSLPYENNSADAAYALESICHCESLDKAAVIKEMMRVLKPGKRFVIIDGFVKKNPESFSSILRYCYKEICNGWALPSFPFHDLVIQRLKEYGAEEIKTKDLSFRVAPSVLHSPFVVIYFLMKKLLKGEKLNRVRVGHLKACFLGLMLGMHRKSFAYSMITGRKTK
jgi:MPBQ/MSBQ methyltransferase